MVEAVAEELPFGEGVFDLVLMVTTACFLDDVDRAFSEAQRVLAPGGYFIVGFLDRGTPLGSAYEARRADSEFYRLARFVSSEEVLAALARAGFSDLRSVQTIFQPPGEMRELSPVEPDYGRGLFVVMRGWRAATQARGAA